jgi:hypothetical protein
MTKTPKRSGDLADGEQRAASLFPTLSRRSPKRARSSPWGLALGTRAASWCHSTSKRATGCGKWSGTEVKIDGEDRLIMKESDVRGVIEGASATKKKAA